MQSASALVRAAYLGTWLAYALAVLYLDWSNATLAHMLLGLLAFAGVIAAIGWFLSPQRLFLVCIVISGALLVAYAVEWGLQVHLRYTADPSQGLLREIGLQAQMWDRLFEHRWTTGNYWGAALEAYWLYGMALLQFILLATIGVRRLRLARRANGNAAA